MVARLRFEYEFRAHSIPTSLSSLPPYPYHQRRHSKRSEEYLFDRSGEQPTTIAATDHIRPTLRGCVLPYAPRAAVSASPPAEAQPASPLREPIPFHSSSRTQAAACSANVTAHKNTAPAQRAARAPWHGSIVRWRQSPAAAPATGTCRLRDASSASLPACVCEEPHRARTGAS